MRRLFVTIRQSMCRVLARARAGAVAALAAGVALGVLPLPQAQAMVVPLRAEWLLAVVFNPDSCGGISGSATGTVIRNSGNEIKTLDAYFGSITYLQEGTGMVLGQASDLELSTHIVPSPVAQIVQFGPDPIVAARIGSWATLAVTDRAWVQLPSEGLDAAGNLLRQLTARPPAGVVVSTTDTGNVPLLPTQFYYLSSWTTCALSPGASIIGDPALGTGQVINGTLTITTHNGFAGVRYFRRTIVTRIDDFHRFATFSPVVEFETEPLARFLVHADFRLAGGRRPINPVQQPVTLQVGEVGGRGFSAAIPLGPNGFTESNDGGAQSFQFQGLLNGTYLQMQVVRTGGDYHLEVEAQEFRLTDPINPKPVKVVLIIGDDKGEETVTPTLIVQ